MPRFAVAFYYNINFFNICSGRLAQLVEHSLDVRRVSGSSPLTSTKFSNNLNKI